MTVALRVAVLADCERVYDWNFAADVRAVSNDPTIVDVARHAAWFVDRLRRPAFWIIEADGIAVGSVRIDDGRISIALDPRARGKGIGKTAIRRACAAWAAPVIANIRTENTASRACFEACGFTPADPATYHWSP
jgi:RimJ/RimL family protein N-acetyltransferase